MFPMYLGPFSYSGSQLNALNVVDATLTTNATTGVTTSTANVTNNTNNFTFTLNELAITDSSTTFTARAAGVLALGQSLPYTISLPPVTMSAYNGSIKTGEGGSIPLVNITNERIDLVHGDSSLTAAAIITMDMATAETLAPWVNKLVKTVINSSQTEEAMDPFYITVSAPSDESCMIQQIVSGMQFVVYNPNFLVVTGAPNAEYHTRRSQTQRSWMVPEFMNVGTRRNGGTATVNGIGQGAEHKAPTLLQLPSFWQMLSKLGKGKHEAGLRRTDSTAPVEADMESTTSNFTGYALSGFRVLPAASGPWQFGINVRSAPNDPIVLLARGSMAPLGVTVDSAPHPNYAALDFDPHVPQRTLFGMTDKAGDNLESNGAWSVTSEFALELETVGLQNLVNELWRAMSEGIDWELDVTVHGGEAVGAQAGVITTLFKEVAHSLKVLVDARLEAQKPSCTDCIDVTGADGCAESSLLHFFDDPNRAIWFWVSSTSTTHVTLEVEYNLNGTAVYDAIQELKAKDGWKFAVEGTVNCHGDFVVINIGADAFDTPEKVKFQVTINNANNLGECVSSIVAGADTCLYLTLKFYDPFITSSAHSFMFTIPFAQVEGKVAPGRTSDFLTTGTAGEAAFAFTFDTSTWHFRIDVALFNPTDLTVHLKSASLDVMCASCSDQRIGSALTLTSDQALTGRIVNWISMEVDVAWGNMGLYYSAVTIGAAVYGASAPEVNVLNIHLKISIQDFDFDLILNQYDVLGSLHATACQGGNQCPGGVCVDTPGVDWDSQSLDDLANTPYYLNVKVKRATFNFWGSCLDSNSFQCHALWYGGKRGTNTDPYVEIKVDGTFWDGSDTGHTTSVYHKSLYKDESALTSQCEADSNSCHFEDCKGSKDVAGIGIITCANCKNVDGTCWAYPEFDYIAQIGPMKIADARTALISFEVKDYDSITNDDSAGSVSGITCAALATDGTGCSETVSLGTTSFGSSTDGGSGGSVTYELSLWTFSGTSTRL